MTTLLFASQLLTLLQQLSSAGLDVAAELEWGVGLVNNMVAEKRDPTQEEWDALNARTAALRERLHSDEK